MNVTLEQFRKQVIRTSLFAPTTLPSAFKRLGFVQADPIRRPARAQDLILRQRAKHYKAGDLEAKYPKLQLEEFYRFAYGFGSHKLWNLTIPNSKEELSDSEQAVLATVRKHGVMHPKELERLLGSGRMKNYWGGYSRSAKLALESLHDRGRLRIQRRENGIRIYELADNQEPACSKRERFKQIILATLPSMGPTSRGFLLSELRHFKCFVESRTERLAAIDELITAGQLRSHRIGSVEYLSLTELKSSGVALDQVRILAPFDPIVRDRQRFQHLWDWEYRFEAYTPAKKRKLGYYAMPVLWEDRVVGWANAEVRDRHLFVKFGYVTRRPAEKRYHDAAEKEIQRMAQFLGLDESAYDLSV